MIDKHEVIRKKKYEFNLNFEYVVREVLKISRNIIIIQVNDCNYRVDHKNGNFCNINK